jgi:hypothetical protein
MSVLYQPALRLLLLIALWEMLQAVGTVAVFSWYLEVSSFDSTSRHNWMMIH